MGKRRFSFYESFYEAAKMLDGAQRLAFYDALCAYAFDGREASFEDPMLSMAFMLAVPNVDSSLREGAGGRPSKTNGKTHSETTEKTSAETSRKTTAKTSAKTSEKTSAKTTKKTAQKTSAGTRPQDRDRERDMDRDKEGDIFLPLEERKISPLPAPPAAAGDGAPPDGAETQWSSGIPPCECGGRFVVGRDGRFELSCDRCGRPYSPPNAAEPAAPPEPQYLPIVPPPEIYPGEVPF